MDFSVRFCDSTAMVSPSPNQHQFLQWFQTRLRLAFKLSWLSYSLSHLGSRLADWASQRLQTDGAHLLYEPLIRAAGGQITPINGIVTVEWVSAARFYLSKILRLTALSCFRTWSNLSQIGRPCRLQKCYCTAFLQTRVKSS